MSFVPLKEVVGGVVIGVVVVVVVVVVGVFVDVLTVFTAGVGAVVANDFTATVPEYGLMFKGTAILSSITYPTWRFPFKIE